MGKNVENPKRYIISCRVSDEELQTLTDQAREANTNISSLVRQSLNLSEPSQAAPSSCGA